MQDGLELFLVAKVVRIVTAGDDLAKDREHSLTPASYRRP
jgi:hypothetical protein